MCRILSTWSHWELPPGITTKLRKIRHTPISQRAKDLLDSKLCSSVPHRQLTRLCSLKLWITVYLETPQMPPWFLGNCQRRPPQKPQSLTVTPHHRSSRIGLESHPGGARSTIRLSRPKRNTLQVIKRSGDEALRGSAIREACEAVQHLVCPASE
ncbi:hypothetical protein NLI96_g7165 [Meripilus lineatus]|uniref:Uncharacterized protein n=1 Tax=Meripilus lineatus TaxID=2056292 RepID=A0AAD5YD71_9APHY|nr:hypothetical protein NLI96_g7165 [Physisporinus lineatus]